MKLLTAFLLDENKQRKLEEIQPEELSRYLGEFILRVKRKDGQDNEPCIKPSKVVFEFLSVFGRTQILCEYYRGHSSQGLRRFCKTKTNLSFRKPFMSL